MIEPIHIHRHRPPICKKYGMYNLLDWIKMWHKKFMRTQHKAEWRAWRQPESILQICRWTDTSTLPSIHLSIFSSCHLFPCHTPNGLSNHFITSVMHRIRPLGPLLWYTPEWVATLRKYVENRKKERVVDEPCKAVWQVNFSPSLKSNLISFSDSRQLAGKWNLAVVNWTFLEDLWCV